MPDTLHLIDPKLRQRAIAARVATIFVIVLVAACVVVESLGLGRPANPSHRQDPGGLVA